MHNQRELKIEIVMVLDALWPDLPLHGYVLARDDKKRVTFHAQHIDGYMVKVRLLAQIAQYCIKNNCIVSKDSAMAALSSLMPLPPEFRNLVRFDDEDDIPF